MSANAPSKLLIDAPGIAEPLRVELRDGDAVLLGRDPDVARLGPELAGAQRLPLPSPSVSGNHALLSREGAVVTVRDLGSRNGTWLRAPSQRALRVDAEPELRVQLAGAPTAAREHSEPEEPRYTSREDFADALADAVSRWLSARGIKARVVASRAHPEGAAMGAGSFPLAGNGMLWVLAEHTLDIAAERLIEGLRPWVARQNSALLAEEETRGDGMILASAEIRAAHRAVVEAARRGVPSLVFLGPSGSGKERLARTFHRHTGRGGPFVAINCALLDRALARAELFGAEVGAYTGLDRPRVGAVERAHGGTLFLDEVGEMSPEVQGFLLRFLDEGGEFERMNGDGRLRHADVRVVCATNRDLRDAAQRGQFRKDLWWRLGVQVVEVPPLRRRFDDVTALLRARRLGAVSALDALHPDALALLRAHAWEGNFRELTNLVKRLPLASRPQELTEPVVRHALGAGALSPLAEPPAPRPATSAATAWEEIARVAALAFAEDHGRDAPETWSDVATFVEQYLKPVAVQRMAAPGDEPSGEGASFRELAARLEADSKTIAKHLRRGAERFAR